MAKIYDISAKLTNELPVLKITDDIIVTINNRKSTILNIQAMMQESERQAEPDSEIKQMNKILQMIVGAEKADMIERLDLPVNEYKTVYEAVMKIAQGVDPDEPFQD